MVMTGIASIVYIFAQEKSSSMLKCTSSKHSKLCILTFILLPCPFFNFIFAFKELRDKSYFIFPGNVTNAVDRA